MSPPVAPFPVRAVPTDYVKLEIPGVVDYVPGQPGTVYLTNLNGIFPKIVINGVKARRSMGGKVKVPMRDGSKRMLKLKEKIPGYPTVTMDGVELYRHPSPPKSVSWVVWLPLAHVVMFAGILVSIGLHYYYVWLLKRPHVSNAVKVGVPIAISGSILLVNILVIVTIVRSPA